MKNIRWIITLMLLVGYGSVFGQSRTTKASIMEDAFGAIRAEMVRDACGILEFDDQIAMKLITNKSVVPFDEELNKRLKTDPDNLTLRYLHLIVGDANTKAGGLGGDQLDKYQTRIATFRSRVKYGYEEGDRLATLFGDDPVKLQQKKDKVVENDERYKREIEALVKECNDFNNHESEGSEYNGVVFKPLIDNKKVVVDTPTPTPTPKTKPEPTDKDKQAWNGCAKTFEKVVQFIKDNPDNTYVPEADEWLWGQINGGKGASARYYREYLNIRGNNPIHKDDAEKWIMGHMQDSTLNQCVNWSDYEIALKQWPNDKDFIDKVNEACWERCKGIDEIEEYESYISTFKDYGKGKYYKEAKERIKELQALKGGGGESSGGNNSAEPDGNGDDDTKDGNGLWHIVAAVVVAALLAGLFIRKRKKSQTQQTNATPTPAPESNPTPAPTTTHQPTPNPTPTPVPASTSTPTSTSTSTSTSTYTPKSTPKQGEWVVVGASVKGNGHIQSKMPCQDSNKFELLGKGWGIAVVSDGAGSAAHSDTGSKVVVERGVVHFKKLIEKEGWMDKNTLPSDAEWLQKSYFVLKTIRNEVEMFAKKNNIDIKSLSATCLTVVFSPMGLLVVHVGDGRMGCKTASGGWKAIMTPHKGEEANQTLFLVSDFWDIPNYVQSGVLVPESLVVREPVEAFAVMSDGCESTAWLCTAQNAETGKYYDQNKPFEGFFNPLEETLASFHKDNVPEEERKEKWYNFIESGTKGFVKEQDDKTMILGVLL